MVNIIDDEVIAELLNGDESEIEDFDEGDVIFHLKIWMNYCYNFLIQLK